MERDVPCTVRTLLNLYLVTHSPQAGLRVQRKCDLSEFYTFGRAFFVAVCKRRLHRKMNTSFTNSTLYELEPFALSMSSTSALALQTINFFVGLPLNIYVCILLIRAGKLDGRMNTSLTNSTLYELELFALSMSSESVLALQTINFFVGLPLNIYVCILLIRAGKLDGSVIFSFSQTVSEILYALQLPLCVLCRVDVRNLCFLTLVTFVSATCINARLVFQGCVCFERYLAVVHPVTFLKHKSIKHRLAAAACMWIYSCFCGALSVNNFLGLPYLALGVIYAIMLIMHLFLCFSVLRVLRRAPPGEGGGKDGGVSAAKRKAFELVSFSLLIFLFQTVPLAVVFGHKNEMLSVDAFILAFTIITDFNVVGGIALPVLILHQMGRLTFIRKMNASLTNSTLHEVDQLRLDLSSYILIFMQVLNFCLGLPLNVYVIVLLWFVCFERYLAVVHPVSFLKCKLMKCRVAISVFMWIQTRGANALDLVYTNIPSAYRAEPRPHLGYSDHISVMLIPAYRPLVRRSKPVLKQVRTWPSGAISALQDCFEHTDWQMFREAATYSTTTDLEEYTSSVTSYIGKCIDDVTVSKTITNL
ncbi:hypothetical protein NFI96_000713 [Prochilodus magdalenae]|nr:hypothetical protein NFI96_000713 [Prochilodus magdalenae]